MENVGNVENLNVLVILVGLLSAVITFISIYIYFYIKELKSDKKKSIIEKSKKKHLDIDHSIKSLEFFNNLLLTKYQFYFSSEILAYFLSSKEMPKKEISSIKEKFYLDVSKTLNNDQRDNLLKIFSIDGVKLYIHQTFLRLLNESNIKYLKTDTSLDKKALDAVYDINKSNEG